MELRKSQEVHHRIIQKQLKISMTKKYLKKDIISTRKVENYWWYGNNVISMSSRWLHFWLFTRLPIFQTLW